MKKTAYNYIILLILIVTVGILTGCQQDPANRIYKIGVAQNSTRSWHQKMNEELTREAFMQRNMQLEIRTANGRVNTQMEDIRYFILKKVDLIVVVPTEKNEDLAKAIDEAIHAGIPVIETDNRSGCKNISAFIGADNVNIAKNAMAHVADLLQGKGNIVEITGNMKSTSAQERHLGFMEELKKYPEIKLLASVDADWDEEKAAKLTDSLMDKNLTIDLIFSQTDCMAKGANRSTARHGQENTVKFIGFNGIYGKNEGLDLVDRGLLEASFTIPTGGEKIVQTAIKILTKQPYQKETLLNTTVITKRTAPIIASQELKISKLNTNINHLSQLTNIYTDQSKEQNVILIIASVAILLIGFILMSLYKYYNTRKRLNQSLLNINQDLASTYEQMEQTNKQLILASENLKNETQSKLTFFTNISHDIRTPLTLIDSPLKQILEGKELTNDARKLLGIAQKNVQILMHLVNDILDFRKCDSQQMAVNYTPFDLVESIENWSSSFKQLAINKKLIFKQICDSPKIDMVADTFKIGRIYYNLLSNAFKFTPENGTVQVKISQVKWKERLCIQFEVSDTGCGIGAEHLSHIFENFYRATKKQNGTGIGLALVKSFVELHNGIVSVRSAENAGSTFIVIIPMKPTEDELAAAKEKLRKLQEGELTSEANEILEALTNKNNANLNKDLKSEREEINQSIQQLKEEVNKDRFSSPEEFGKKLRRNIEHFNSSIGSIFNKKESDDLPVQENASSGKRSRFSLPKAAKDYSTNSNEKDDVYTAEPINGSMHQINGQQTEPVTTPVVTPANEIAQDINTTAQDVSERIQTTQPQAEPVVHDHIVSEVETTRPQVEEVQTSKANQTAMQTPIDASYNEEVLSDVQPIKKPIITEEQPVMTEPYQEIATANTQRKRQVAAEDSVKAMEPETIGRTERETIQEKTSPTNAEAINSAAKESSVQTIADSDIKAEPITSPMDVQSSASKHQDKTAESVSAANKDLPTKPKDEKVLPPQPIDVDIELPNSQKIADLDEEDLTAPLNENGEKFTVLVIDDNEDIRDYARTILEDQYTIITAVNGQDGLDVAHAKHPSVIVCDVMMPVMDGLECCQHLKTEEETKQIPVIMLTACTSDEQLIQGYECGADDYMTKPFNYKVLLAHIKSQIENRYRIQQHFVENEIFKSDKMSDEDKAFAERIMQLIEENIADPSLSVESLGEKLKMSRTQLYRKIKALCDYSPNELLKETRLKRASELLASTDKSISEISYAVGFTTPSYFTRCFKAKYGMLPGDKRNA